MITRDVVTREEVSVTLDTPGRKIASLLVKHRIGAVPVIDSSGAPIGIVSESDLIRPDRVAREAWRELAAWCREFAERAGNPVIWEARLRTAAELEQEADLLEGQSRAAASIVTDLV